ncbi:conserved hypothetical protein [Ricinus communis]|uniref:Uncharacterized protein n=1 Tax=Ricinus communis TaxID=3988 RepID=B9T681_RICCO|nr:conserved hypothetical protein [Ricinus communis]
MCAVLKADRMGSCSRRGSDWCGIKAGAEGDVIDVASVDNGLAAIIVLRAGASILAWVLQPSF